MKAPVVNTLLSPIEVYRNDIQNRGFIADKSQENAVMETQALYEKLTQAAESSADKGIFSFLKGSTKPPAILGLYFWGDVGRGKSYLIDTFFNCLPFQKKKRVHFNRFMQDIHNKLELLPKTPDPLIVVAQALAREYRIICIDEFHVDDITDAMILAGLLEALFDQQVTLVCTSNIEPEKLYQNGLQRERFLPAIDLINEHTKVIELENGIDYRMALTGKYDVYHVVEEGQSQDIMRKHLLALAGVDIQYDQSVVINDRKIKCLAQGRHTLWFDFNELCQTARSAKDYIALANQCKTILVSDIRPMNDNHNDVA
ncbi:MAG TPA: cell division protein ZapE, partial [Gammaproteobacteria bacterium]|nr:cell division protein ZapE [Gammaproteobacteria bacterium]